MSDLKAAIKVSIIDAFSAPLKHLSTELVGVKGGLTALKASGDASASIARTTAALGKIGATGQASLQALNRALGATGNAADAVKQRMAAFTKVAELTGAVRGARKFEREAHEAMVKSGGSADAAAKHFEAFGKLDALKQQLAEARRFERGVKAATVSAGKAIKGVDAPTKQAAASFSALSTKAIGSLRATDTALGLSGAQLKAFEKLAELRRAEDGFKRVASAARGVGPAIGNAKKQASGLRESLRGVADAHLAVQGVKGVAQGFVGTAMKPIRAFIDYDEALGEVESALPRGTGRTSADFVALKAQQDAVGMSSRFSQADIALAQADGLKAGLGIIGTQAAIPVATDLATAASNPREEVRPEQALGILSKTASMFVIDAGKNSRRIADAYIAAADASQSDTTGLFAAVSEQSGSMAASLGMSPEQLLTDLAMLSNKGQDKTKAGTSWTAMMERFIAPTAPAIEGYKSIGIGAEGVKEFQKLASTGNSAAILEKLAVVTRTYSRDEIDAAKTKTREAYRSTTDEHGKPYTAEFIAKKVQQTESSMTKMTPERVNEAFKKIFETQGSEGVRKLLSNYVVGADGMTEQQRVGSIVAGSPMISREKAAIKERTAKGQEQQMWGNVEAAMLNLGSKFGPEIERVTGIVGNFANSLNSFITEHPTAAKVGGGVVAAGGLAAISAATLATLKGGFGYAAKLVGLGGAAATTVAADGALIAAAGAKVASASAAATSAVAAVGAPTAVGGTGAAAAAAGGGLATTIGAPIAAALVPITAGLIAQRTGDDVKAYDWFMSGGVGKAFEGALKDLGVNGTIAETVGSVGGNYATIAAAPAAALPAVGSGLGRAYDWMTGKGTEPGSGAPKAVPGAVPLPKGPAMAPLLATKPATVPPLLTRPASDAPAPLILAPKLGRAAESATSSGATAEKSLMPQVVELLTDLLRTTEFAAIRDRERNQDERRASEQHLRAMQDMASQARRGDRSGGLPNTSGIF